MVHVNKFSTSTATAALLLFTSVQGHMVMRTPPSYNLYKGDTLLQVDPLDGVKYLYPCQNRYEAGNATTVKAGDVQLVQFTGGAQHGGGSCQFSVSYDDPEKSNGSWNTSAIVTGRVEARSSERYVFPGLLASIFSRPKVVCTDLSTLCLVWRLDAPHHLPRTSSKVGSYC